jgi:hypothetical protein
LAGAETSKQAERESKEEVRLKALGSTRIVRVEGRGKGAHSRLLGNLAENLEEHDVLVAVLLAHLHEVRVDHLREPTSQAALEKVLKVVLGFSARLTSSVGVGVYRACMRRL